MKFNDTLNTYLEILNCSSKKLSKESGLSEPLYQDIEVVKELLQRIVIN